MRPAKAPRGDELRSKHADDGSGRRPLNSTRALSRHVDDYQAAPVVRKTVDTSPVSVAQPGDGAGSPSAADAMMGGRMPQHPCGGMAVGGEGPMANFGVFGGIGNLLLRDLLRPAGPREPCPGGAAPLPAEAERKASEMSTQLLHKSADLEAMKVLHSSFIHACIHCPRTRFSWPRFWHCGAASSALCSRSLTLTDCTCGAVSCA